MIAAPTEGALREELGVEGIEVRWTSRQWEIWVTYKDRTFRICSYSPWDLYEGWPDQEEVEIMRSLLEFHYERLGEEEPGESDDLTEQQIEFLCYLKEGASVSEAAVRAGSSRSVMYRLRYQIPAFGEAWREVRE